MSDDQPPLEDSPASAETLAGRMHEALLVPELAEVYLLLDNVSGIANKQLPDLNGDPLFAGGGNWIEQVCAIRWPPTAGAPQNEALNAAKLIRAKDQLNRMAWPASGASIAFTLMLSGESISPRAAGQGRFARMFGGAQPPPPLIPNPRDRLCNGEPFTRRSLAAIAYPVLHRGMRKSRFIYLLINWFLVISLITTCLMSWQIATGVSLLNRVDGLVRSAQQERGIGAKVALEVARNGQSADGPAADADTDERNAATAGVVGPSAISAPKADAESAEDADTHLQSGTDPIDIVSSDPDLLIPIANLVTWVEDHHALAVLVGGQAQVPVYPMATPRPPDAKSNVEWAAVLIGVLAGTVLPILYGVLGASAAVVRSVAARMSNNTLMPRDLVLALVQLGLGAVIGACVGLFVSTDGNAADGEDGLFGTVHLSASALCFLAGFGVEGVFRALEALVTRVFPAGTPHSPAYPAPPQTPDTAANGR